MILWIFIIVVAATYYFGFDNVARFIKNALHITGRAFLVIAGLAFVGAGILLATLTASSTAFWVGLGVAAVFFFFGFRRRKELTPYEQSLLEAARVVKHPMRHPKERVAKAQELLRQHELRKRPEELPVAQEMPYRRPYRDDDIV